MSTQTAAHLAEWLVQFTGPPVTAFTIWYGLTVRWWTFWIGRALLTSSLAFSLLIDVSLAQYWFNWVAPPWLIVVVLALVCAGAWLKLTALVIEKRRARRQRRALRPF